MNNINRFFILTFIIFSCVFLSFDCFGQGKINRLEGHKVPNTSQSNAPISKAKYIGSSNGHDWIDLGLLSGLKWATCNIGASSPSGYGNYYAWGETSPKSDYTWGNCFDCNNETGTHWEIYKIGGNTHIAPTSGHDAARMNWGGMWRLPTATEFQELVDKCKWLWINKDGHTGYQVTGPNGMSIFLPAGGWKGGAGDTEIGKTGHYWSSTLYQSLDSYEQYYGDSNGATLLGFGERFSSSVSPAYRKYGKSIRPVMK